MHTPLRLLIVEDSEDDAFLLLRALRQAGYQPLYQRVETGADFLSALAAQEWELIIADYALPRFSALMALQLLRGQGKDIPFIVISGAIGENMAVEAMKAGAHDYVMKGNFARLGPAVARELREATMRQERHRAQEALRKSEERYRDLFENANDIIYTRDMQGYITSVNKKVELITGLPRECLIGRHINDIVAPEYLGRIQQALALKLDGTLPQTIFEVEAIKPDGERIPLEISSRLLYEDDQPVGVQGIARDIRERRHLEEQLRQAQKMEAIGRLAGGIAHDFNNLLTAILGYSHMIVERLPQHDPIYQDIAEIDKAAQRAAALTRQLLAFSRKQILQPKVLDLNIVVADMEMMLRRLIGEDIELLTRLDPTLQPIKADPGQLEQVVMNLAVNARDAMPHGGTIRLETSNVSLEPPALTVQQAEVPSGTYVQLVVQDTGSGMDKETLGHIFEPFFSTKEQGTGLGLSTVYGIVKQSGGHIWASSAPGSGTTVTIILPQVHEPQFSAGIEKQGVSAQTGSETILLVEDDEAVRHLILHVLRRSGYMTLEARNAREAIALCAQYPQSIHLMVTDVVMPGMSGRELAEHMFGSRPEMRVLYISGYAADRALSTQGLALGQTPFLQKPFTPQAFAYKLREVLDA